MTEAYESEAANCHNADDREYNDKAGIAAENDKKDDACHYREKGASSLKSEVRQHARTPFKVRGTQGVGKQAMGGP